MEPVQTELVVLGAGPGGYAAAFYAADHGKHVVLVEQDPRLGGVCLNRGCIPSKALLHATDLMREAHELSPQRGITFGQPKLDLKRLRLWKEGILDRLAQGVRGLAKSRGVDVWHGRGYFEDSHLLRVESPDGQRFLRYDHAIIAVGSQPAMPKAFDLGNPRVMTSTEALELEDVPGDLLVVGGGYIGLELGTVYATLGSRVVLAEAMGTILAGVDPDLSRLVMRYAERAFKEVRLGANVLKMATVGKQIKVTFTDGAGERNERYDRVLVAVGRVPNCQNLGLEHTNVQRDHKGFITVDAQQRTADPAVLAIGDVVGGAMLAHKATKEARIAIEGLLGETSVFERIVIPAVVFTDPEVAWAGLTETEARQQNIPVEVAKFSWAASGRALSLDRTDGLTKLIVDPATEQILGVGIAGTGAGELISEGVLAIEMGATAADLAETVHPHPTLSETLMEAAESFYGFGIHSLSRPAGPSATRRNARLPS
jgi:dihydrolipoamide dehydrogenase